MLGVLVGLVHAVKVPLMLHFLRDMVTLSKGTWEQCCSCTKRYFRVSFPHLEVTHAELKDFAQVCGLWGCSSC